MHRRFGDAVHVHQPRRVLGVAFVPALQLGGFECLAAEDHLPQGQPVTQLRVFPIGLGELVERRRGLVEDRDPFADQQFQELLGRAAGYVRHHDQAAAVQQRAPQLPHGEIEGIRMEQRPHVPFTEAEPVVGGGEQAMHVAVRHDHALRAAGRAGGVDDVGRVVRAHAPDVAEVARVPAGQV